MTTINQKFTNMKQEKLFKQVELKVREEKLIEKRYGIHKIPDGEPTFTTSQETDIWEIITE
jgi:hypothetical protein